MKITPYKSGLFSIRGHLALVRTCRTPDLRSSRRPVQVPVILAVHPTRVVLKLRVRVPEEHEVAVADAQAVHHDVAQPLLNIRAQLRVRQPC